MAELHMRSVAFSSGIPVVVRVSFPGGMLPTHGLVDSWEPVVNSVLAMLVVSGTPVVCPSVITWSVLPSVIARFVVPIVTGVVIVTEA